MAKAKKIRVAVIGAGNMGRYHVRNYADLKEAELVGVSDQDAAKESLAQQYGTKFYTDYKELLDKEKPEALTIAVPTAYHLEVGKEVMNRGINVLIEKPIASTIKEAQELIDLAKSKSIVFTVGHIERFNPVVRKLKELLDKKTIGDITSIICKRVGGFPKVEPQTDVIIDLAVHDIDIISYLLGRQPSAIHSHGSRTHHSHKVDSAEILLDYGYASGFVQANWINPVKIRTIAVTGSKGYIEGNYVTQQLTYYEHNLQRVNSGFESFVTNLGEPQTHQIEVDFTEPLAVELRTFLKAVADNKHIHFTVSPHDAMTVLKHALEAGERYLTDDKVTTPVPATD